MNILDQFDFPQVAREDFISKGLVQKQLAPNVSDFQMSGHDRGLAYRFFVEAIKNEVKSEVADMLIPDEVVLIQWFKDRKNKPVERVTELPPELLKFRRQRIDAGNGVVRYPVVRDAHGQLECTGGLYKDAFIQFQKGLCAAGLPIDRWGALTISQVATLRSEGINTVEQFAALPVDRVEGRFPKDLVRAFNEAVHFVNKQNASADIKPFADEMLAMKQEIARLRTELEDKNAQIATVATVATPVEKKIDRRTKEYRDAHREANGS